MPEKQFSINFSPHSQPSFLEPLIVNDLQKQGCLWVLCEIPKRRGKFNNILIINNLQNHHLDMGWKIRLLDKILRSKTIPEQSKRGAKTAVQTKLHWNKSSTRNKKHQAAGRTKRKTAGIQPPPPNYYFPLRQTLRLCNLFPRTVSSLHWQACKCLRLSFRPKRTRS